MWKNRFDDPCMTLRVDDGGGVGIGGGTTSEAPATGAPAPPPAPASEPSPVSAPSNPSRQQAVLADMVEGMGPASPRPPQPSIPATATPIAQAIQLAVVPQGVPPTVPVATPQPSPQAAPQQVQQQAPNQQQAAQQAEQYKQARLQVRDQVRSSYALTPEQALGMVTSPETVLPELAADITLNAYEAVASTVFQQIPGIVQQMTGQVIQQMMAAHEAEQSFFRVNEDLRQAPKSEVDRIASLYFQANRGLPGLTAERANREIGILVRNMLGIAPTTSTPVPPVAPPLAQPPGVQPPPTPYGQPQIVARTPIGPGNGAPAPSSAPNVFADMVNWTRQGSTH